MNQTFPEFIDLRTLADELVGQEEYRRVRTELDRAAKAQSCSADLALAQSQCDALGEMLPSPRKRGTLNRQATEGALLQMAVILYERATSAAAKRGERGSVSVIDRLNPDQLSDHHAIVRVRHRALAHVYPNEAVNGEVWQRDLLLAVAEGEAWQPVAATKRIQFNKVTYERLRRQIPVMQALLKERFQANLNKALGFLNAHPLPQSIYQRHTVDPITAFGTRENVIAALAGRTFREISFLGD